MKGMYLISTDGGYLYNTDFCADGFGGLRNLIQRLIDDHEEFEEIRDIRIIPEERRISFYYKMWGSEWDEDNMMEWTWKEVKVIRVEDYGV